MHPQPGIHAHGWIVAGRALENPSRGEDDDVEIHSCGMCGDYVWLSRRTVMFHSMNPRVPIFCCCCTSISTDILRRMVPGIEFGRAPVPDLGRLGIVN